MEARVIDIEQAEKETPEQLYKEVASGPQGLASEEAKQRLSQYGLNALEEAKENPLLKALSYFWGPIPWMIEIAAVLTVAVQHWMDFAIIIVLLVFNAGVGFWEEYKASNALAALKKQLALKARVLRDKHWQGVEAKFLVPGDVIRVRLGDIIPADIKLIEGDYLSVDQAALTGESLPVNKKTGDIAYSGSVAKQGEMLGLVAATGANTYFGRTAQLVESAGAVSHFQKAVMKVGDFLIFLALGLSVTLILVELMRGVSVLNLISFVLILVVASIPVAMPAVLSVTMALGALVLSKMKAIVSRLQSIEEMAGVDILCSDKTGTLTEGKLTLGEPTPITASNAQEIVLAGALASRPEDQDAIDLAVLAGLEDQNVLQQYEQSNFVPFDPVSKRTEATIKDKQGKTFQVSKGAPQVILDLCKVDDTTKAKVEKIVDEAATRGYRTLGVARAVSGGSWNMLGILPLYDPPRADSAQTIAQAKDHGLKVKMVTGDNMAIAREISRQLELGTNIHLATDLFKDVVSAGNLSQEAEAKIEQSDGFAQVFPEHKYSIVKALQAAGHLVAMTGDGVNDAPALKQAEVGIAVSGATDAARAAAALVLTAPGLSTIIQAVTEARRIFERMLSYTIYRIAMTIDIMFFVVISMLFLNVYPITAVMIIILALLDDIPIMTIAYDNTYIDPKPVRWEMHRVLTVSSVLGFLAVIETFGLLLIGRDLQLDTPHLQTLVFLQLVVGGHLMLFVTRTKKPLWRAPYPAWQLLGAIIATQVFAVFMTAYGWLVPELTWPLIGIVWAYNLAWMLVQDVVKLSIYRLIEDRAQHKRKFLSKANQPLHPHGVAKHG